QNQRSLFGFLNSVEPNGFQDFLRDAADDALYGPEALWDYLRANLEPSILSSPDGHRWSMAVEAIERCEVHDNNKLHLQVLKTLALIDLFKQSSGLLATPEVLLGCFPSHSPKRVQESLKDLVDWSLALFKKHTGAYSIYAGSDFNIEQALSIALADIR